MSKQDYILYYHLINIGVINTIKLIDGNDKPKFSYVN